MQYLPGFLGRGARRFAALEAEIAQLKAVQDVQAPEWARAGVGPFSDLPGLELPTAQAELYQRLSWVYTAVTITAQTAAGAAFNVEKSEGERSVAIENHPFEVLLRNPNPLQSRFEFLEAMFAFRQITGNAYIWLNRTSPDAPPSEMWIIPTSQIEPIPDERLYLKGYSYDPGNGSRILLDTWEVCHLKRFHPLNQFVGLSPIEALAVTATGDLAMSQWNTNYFAKQHAKPAGALAFADHIGEADWQRIKKDVEQQHGGTERRMMLLRNAGKTGVSWLQFGVPQKDMEFLKGREFNKEEIFAAFSPGLSSMLAVNATEANSKAGRETFAETTIWPSHQAVGEKFTSDILPAYGDGLIGFFEDVRVTDRALQLEEQQVAYRVLTIGEAREKFYNMEPLGDARDLSLVDGTTVSVSVGATPDGEVIAGEDGVPKGEIFGYHIAEGVVTKNEVREGLGLPPQDESDGNKLQDATSRLSVVQAAVAAGIDIENALQLSGLALPKPLKVPIPPPPASKMEATEVVTARADLLRWQRKAYKRTKRGAEPACDFESDAIPPALNAAIRGALGAAKTGDDVRGVFAAVIDSDDQASLWRGYP